MAGPCELRHNIVVKLATPELTTREAIARSILENGPSSAVALSERLGITPAGIRRHLDALVEEGIIEPREPRTRELGRGRPSKVFVMTDMGRTSFEHSYDDLAIAALRYLAQSQPGGGDVRSFARTRAEEMERKFHNTSAKKSNSNPALALADFLTREGYAASTHEVPIGVEICQHHCPIAHVAAEFPQLCETETEIFSKILGTHVQRLATIAHGDGVCTTVIPRNRTDLFFNSKTDSPTERTER
ncbi:MAG: transcriptional regulator [Actinobacteria bacterium]|nr:transcriptional regulator [Actinomycetota bacterium]